MSAPQRAGEDGTAHLGGAFLRAGAQAVVASRAKLDLGSTLELARIAMRGMVAEGRSPAEAMRDARREVSARPQWAHPYYHSLMQVLGVGDRPVLEASATTGTTGTTASPRRRWPAVAIGGLVVVLAVAVSRRRRRRRRAA